MKSIDLLVRLLEETGVRWVFGVPSGPVLPLIEALRKSPVDYVLTATETSAGFMASTIGALTGVPGVCVSTLGPGATNLATGVGCAWLDRSPVIAITCNVATPWIERRTQMRIDHHCLFRSLTKATYSLQAGQMGHLLAEAISLASAEPPGPVHLDLPEDVCLAEATEVPEGDATRTKLPDISEETFQHVSDALRRSRKPLVVTGLTFTRCKAGGRLLNFIEKQNLPFVSTLHAKGFLPESHPSYLGVLGRARRTDVQAIIRKADLIVAIGYDPVEINYEEWVEDTPVVHLSMEPSEVAPGVKMEVNQGGDLDQMVEKINEIPPLPNDWSAAEWEGHRRVLEKSLRPNCKGLGIHHVLDILRERLPRDGILSYDVGAHTHQIATQWRVDLPRTCLATNGWSSMGYGMPAAYAAKLVHPDRAVVGVVGDGCFQMTVGELAMARRLGLAVPIIVLNDGWLGLIKVKQERKGYGYSGVYLGDPPDSPAHYFGVPCRAARDAGELSDAIEWGFSLNGPSVIETFIDVGPYSYTVYD
jgi:acetolactate synthase-1/2/3 large subunit